jgi:hypothetical protein
VEKSDPAIGLEGIDAPGGQAFQVAAGHPDKPMPEEQFMAVVGQQLNRFPTGLPEKFFPLSLGVAPEDERRRFGSYWTGPIESAPEAIL